MFLRDDERFLVTEKLIRQLTFTGTKDELQSRLQVLTQAGYKQFTIQLVEHQYDALEQWADVFGL